MKKYLYNILFLSLSLLPTFFAGPLLAQTENRNFINNPRLFLDETQKPTGLSSNKDAVLVAIQVIQVGLGLVGFIFFCLMVYAGFMWMLDRGNEDRAVTAKATFTAAVSGVIVIVAAYAVSLFITNFVSGR